MNQAVGERGILVGIMAIRVKGCGVVVTHVPRCPSLSLTAK